MQTSDKTLKGTEYHFSSHLKLGINVLDQLNGSLKYFHVEVIHCDLPQIIQKLLLCASLTKILMHLMKHHNNEQQF